MLVDWLLRVILAILAALIGLIPACTAAYTRPEISAGPQQQTSSQQQQNVMAAPGSTATATYSRTTTAADP